MAVNFEARRFISPTLRAQLRRRMAELLAVACALAGLTLLLALVSYSPADPSFDTATAARTGNLAGPFGATFADLTLQEMCIRDSPHTAPSIRAHPSEAKNPPRPQIIH